ncbi:hypothetical protein ALC57_00144, partial [Trachymyrmex cornetzi]
IKDSTINSLLDTKHIAPLWIHDLTLIGVYSIVTDCFRKSDRIPFLITHFLSEGICCFHVDETTLQRLLDVYYPLSHLLQNDRFRFLFRTL